MSASDELLKNNEEYASGFDKGELPSRPAGGGQGEAGAAWNSM